MASSSSERKPPADPTDIIVVQTVSGMINFVQKQLFAVAGNAKELSDAERQKAWKEYKRVFEVICNTLANTMSAFDLRVVDRTHFRDHIRCRTCGIVRYHMVRCAKGEQFPPSASEESHTFCLDCVEEYCRPEKWAPKKCPQHHLCRNYIGITAASFAPLETSDYQLIKRGVLLCTRCQSYVPLYLNQTHSCNQQTSQPKRSNYEVINNTLTNLSAENLALQRQVADVKMEVESRLSEPVLRILKCGDCAAYLWGWNAQNHKCKDSTVDEEIGETGGETTQDGPAASVAIEDSIVEQK